MWSTAFLLICFVSTSVFAACPCKNISLCKNVQTNYSKELYGFIGGSNSHHNDSSFYNWTYITALAIKQSWINETGMDEFMCTAHSHNVRLIYWNKDKIPFTNDINVTMAFIEQLFNETTAAYYDGVTFDYEGSMLWNQPQSQQYVNLINLTTQYFHQHLPGSTISVCVAFEAYLNWGRQYDYYGLAMAADYLYIMGYDTNIQIFDGQCIARAVAPYENIQRGVQSYLNLQIPPSKLILGVPWYGKSFTCIMPDMDGGETGHYCPIIPVGSKGVNCSSGTRTEIAYAAVMSRMYKDKWNVTGIRWDDTQKTPYFNFLGHNKVNDTIQVWYDDPESLTWKYKYAKSKGLRGLGPFQFGDIVFDNTDDEKMMAQQIWTVFDSFYL